MTVSFLNTKLKSAVMGSLRDYIYEKHVTDLILEKGLKFDGEKLIGDDDVVNDFKVKYPNAFKPAQPVPKFSASTTDRSGVKDNDVYQLASLTDVLESGASILRQCTNATEIMFPKIDIDVLANYSHSRNGRSKPHFIHYSDAP